MISKLGVDKLDARCFVRNLTRRGVASSFMKDMGRQRVTCFVARRFTDNSKTNNEIEREKKKHHGLTHGEEVIKLEEGIEDEDHPVDLDESFRKSSEEVPEKSEKKTFVTGSGIQVTKLEQVNPKHFIFII